MSFSPGKDRNFIAALRRTMESAWFGRDVSAIAQAPAILNGESVTAVNAAGTGTISMIGVNSSNVVLAPSGLTIPAGQTFSNLGVAATSVVNGLTALAGGGQTGATPITASLNRFTTVATGGDSSLLPSSTTRVGSRVVVKNAGAASMNVFPATGEFINALSVNTAFAVANGKTAEFFCIVSGTWDVLLSA